MTDSKYPAFVSVPKTTWVIFGLLLFIVMFSDLRFRALDNYRYKARYIHAHEEMRTIGLGFDKYRKIHGYFPELIDFHSIVSDSSPLVKENLIPKSISATDPWGGQFHGQSTKQSYTLECDGDPSRSDDYPPFKQAPSQP